MNNKELIAWLKENSSGVYRPAFEAAERMEEMINLLEDAANLIEILRRIAYKDQDVNSGSKDLIEEINQSVNR